MKLFGRHASIVDTFLDTWGQANQDITSILRNEFQVRNRTEEIFFSPFSKVNGTAILQIGDACSFYGHFPFTV